MINGIINSRAPRTYKLVRWVIRKNKNGTARVHLHGIRSPSWFAEDEKHIDYVPLALFPGETDEELVRCAAAASPNTWWIETATDSAKFAGRFYLPLDKSLASTLPPADSISSSNTP